MVPSIYFKFTRRIDESVCPNHIAHYSNFSTQSITITFELPYKQKEDVVLIPTSSCFLSVELNKATKKPQASLCAAAEALLTNLSYPAPGALREGAKSSPPIVD